MKPYNKNLKQASRYLRNNMTDAEKLLWSRLRNKQILGVKFMPRCKNIDTYGKSKYLYSLVGV